MKWRETNMDLAGTGYDEPKVTESVEKMRVKERFINTQHDGLREEYLQVCVLFVVVDCCWKLSFL